MTASSTSVFDHQKVHEIIEPRLAQLIRDWQRESGHTGTFLSGQEFEFATCGRQRRFTARMAFLSESLSHDECKSRVIHAVPVWIAVCPAAHMTHGDDGDFIDAALAAGVQWIWVLHPWARYVRQYSRNSQTQHISHSGVLSGGDVLPGLAIPVSAVFDSVPSINALPQLWTDRLFEKHECFNSPFTEVRECIIGDEVVRYRLPESFPAFQDVTGAFRRDLLFLCGTTTEEYVDGNLGAMLVGRLAEDGIYNVHVWHELFPGACKRLQIGQ